MTAQSQPSETNPLEVSPTEEVQSEVPSAPEKPSDNLEHESWNKIQADRDRYRTELEDIQRQRDELSMALDSKFNEDERARFNETQRLKAIEEENRALKDEKEEMLSEQVRNRLLENEFPKLKGLKSVAAIKGTEEEQRVALKYVEDELKAYKENEEQESGSKPEAELSSPAIENVSKGKGNTMSPEEFAKLSLAEKAKYIGRKTSGKSLMDLKLK